MTDTQARAVLRHHAHLGEGRDGLLGQLRPYRGLNVEHLVEITEALVTLGRSICTHTTADRVVMGDLWNICFTVRRWTRGPHEPTFHGRDFISAEDKAILDDWLDYLEQWVNGILHRGSARFDWHIFQRSGHATRIAFALPHIIGELHDEMNYDPDFTEDTKIPNCKLLTAMGPAGAPAADTLRRLIVTTSNPEVREAARAALVAVCPTSSGMPVRLQSAESAKVETGARRLLIGVALWSNCDLRLLDLIGTALKSDPDGVRVEVFNLDELAPPAELQRHLSNPGTYAAPPIENWALGPAKEAASNFVARLQLLIPRIGEVSQPPAVGYWEAGQLKESAFGFFGRQLIGRVLGFDPNLVLEQPAG